MTLYTNQVREINLDTGEVSQWQDACDGHDTFYEAVACRDYQVACEKGEISTLIGILTYTVTKRKRVRLEHRVIKQTVIEEIIESDAELGPPGASEAPGPAPGSR